MKPSLILLGALAFSCLVTPVHLGAQEPPSIPHITVSGSSVVRVAPDEVNLTLGIETREKSLVATRDENERRTAAVMTALKNAGLQPEAIKTDRVYAAPQYERYDSMVIAHYVMRQNIAVKLARLDRFSSLVMSAIEAGATHVNDVEFVTSESRKHRDQARALALRAAREKAAAMAAELGVKIGKVLSITEDSTSFRPWREFAANSSFNSAMTVESSPRETDGSLALGLITVSANVTVRFALE